jgi:hypothetical protein
MTDLVQLLVRNRTRGWLHRFPEVCEDLRIDRICFGELSISPCEISHLSGVDDQTGSPAFTSA